MAKITKVRVPKDVHDYLLKMGKFNRGKTATEISDIIQDIRRIKLSILDLRLKLKNTGLNNLDRYFKEVEALRELTEDRRQIIIFDYLILELTQIEHKFPNIALNKIVEPLE
jgi:hypothetical protein